MSIVVVVLRGTQNTGLLAGLLLGRGAEGARGGVARPFFIIPSAHAGSGEVGGGVEPIREEGRGGSTF